ncbi:hypothetical protein ABBQ38_011179 [Trebouxia sp. C0009 RCD-2024]
MTDEGTYGWLVLLGGLLAGAAGLFIFTIGRSRLLYDLHKIPGPAGWPLLGNALDVIGSKILHHHQLLTDWTQKYGQVFIWHLGLQPVLVVTDPDEVARLCNNSNKQANLPKWAKSYLITEARAPHYSLFGTPNLEEWKSYRKTTNAAFSPENMRKAYPKIYGAVLRGSHALKQLCKQGPVDVSDLALRLTADVIGSFGFEHDFGALRLETGSDGNLQLAPQPFLQDVKTWLEYIVLVFSSPWYKLLHAALPWRAEAKRVRNGLLGVRQSEDELANLFRSRGVQPTSNSSLWACLGRLVNYKDGTPVNHDALAINTRIFLVAGYETTAHLITWALLELASDRALQDQVRKELRTAGLVPTAQQPQPRDLEWADLTKLPVLESVIKETLRLHATAPLGTFRITDKDMVVGGYRVPKNTPVQISPYPMHRSSANFVRPLDFWPERWAQPTSSLPKDPEYPDATPAGNRRNISGSWKPFSLGPRNCIGQTLALAEARTALAILIASFQFDLADGFRKDQYLQHEQVWRITLQPKDRLMLSVTPLVKTP